MTQTIPRHWSRLAKVWKILCERSETHLTLPTIPLIKLFQTRIKQQDRTWLKKNTTNHLQNHLQNKYYCADDVEFTQKNKTTKHTNRVHWHWVRLRENQNSNGKAADTKHAKQFTTTYSLLWNSPFLLWLHWYGRDKIWGIWFLPLLLQCWMRIIVDTAR